MKNIVVRRDTCRLCDGDDLELVVQLTPTPIGAAYVTESKLGEAQDQYPIDLFLCRGCGHAQLVDVVDPDVLFGDAVEVTSVSLGLVDHLRSLADSVMGYVEAPEGLLAVDIGSNDGTFLKFFKNKGMRVLGVDPGRHVAGIANKSGIETLPTLFTSDLARKIKDERGPASTITANRVFANIDDLHDIVEGIQVLLKDDGVFVFETGYLVDLLEQTLVDVIYHEHLGYESVRSLVPFFRHHGMELIDAERVPVKGGSLRGIVQHIGGPRKVSPSIAKLTTFEEGQRIYSAEPFKSFVAKVDKAKTQLSDLLRDLKSKGKVIAGYGAAVGSTTLIYHFGLSETLSFLVDDDHTKWGLYSPGHHLPVLSPQALYDQKPDYVVILAWRYTTPIVREQAAYIDQGGHFVVPLPELRVI
jgi:hypothetical protein